ncbi:MAG: glycosyltransferase family 4 protein, partial [bacterium]
MRIALPYIVSRSGSDVFFRALHAALCADGMDSRLIPLGHRHEFLPVLSATERAALAEADVIHTSVEHGSLVHIPGRPLVLTAHHNVLDPAYQNYTGLLQKLFHHVLVHPRQERSLRAASAVICVSEATQRSYAASYPGSADRLQVVYHGIDTRRFVPGDAGQRSESIGRRFSILFVGHMTRRKGADLLPAIMDRLGPDYTLTCVGQRNAAGHRTVTPSGAEIFVRQAASDDELLRLYQECDVLLFPSRLEGFGYAVAEAMSCGKPVVATRGSSMPELVDHERGGLLCEENNVTAFADAVRRICETPGLPTAMGIHNRS